MQIFGLRQTPEKAKALEPPFWSTQLCLRKPDGATPLPLQYFSEEQEPLFVQLHIVQLQDVSETPHQRFNACTYSREVKREVF